MHVLCLCFGQLRETIAPEGDRNKGKDTQGGAEQIELRQLPSQQEPAHSSAQPHSAAAAAANKLNEARENKHLLEKSAAETKKKEKEKDGGSGGEEFADPSAQVAEGLALGIEPAALASTPNMVRMRSNAPGTLIAQWPRSLMRLHFVPRAWRLEHRRTMFAPTSRPRSMASAAAFERDGEDRADAAAVDSLADGMLMLAHLPSARMQ